MIEFLQLHSPLFYCLILVGVLIGVIFGAVPGMTATMAVAVCLPVTYALDLPHALGLLLGLYVGGISGGLIPAILLNIPGTPSSVATTFDGYPMAQNGEGEKALKIGIAASFFGGLFSLVVLFLFAPALSDFAIKFSYVEKFLIVLLAMTLVASLSKNKLLGVLSGVLGVWVSLVGNYQITDGGNGSPRLIFEFMEPYLGSGFSLLPVLVGIFGLAGVFLETERKASKASPQTHTSKRASGFSWRDLKGQLINLLRSSGLGTFVGILPGVGGSAASVLSYAQAKHFSKQSAQFGKGAPAGLIASESANNGLTGGALVPLLSLGIPGDSTTAVLIAAFTLQGVQVGPLFINENLDTWHTIVFALLVANLAMVTMMFTSIKHIAKVVLVPKAVLYPIIVMMCVVGAYAINNGVMFDVWTLLIFGGVGYVMVKVGLAPAAFINGFILGRSAEVYFVKTLESFGTYTIFFTKSPIAVVQWILIILSVALSAYFGRKNASE